MSQHGAFAAPALIGQLLGTELRLPHMDISIAVAGDFDPLNEMGHSTYPVASTHVSSTIWWIKTFFSRGDGV